MSAQSGLNMPAGSDQHDAEELTNTGVANPLEGVAEADPTVRALMGMMQVLMRQHAEQIKDMEKKFEERMEEPLNKAKKAKEDEEPDVPPHP